MSVYEGLPDLELIQSYRHLVAALLAHTWIDDEGTEWAIADFNATDYPAAKILRLVALAQREESASAGDAVSSAVVPLRRSRP